MRVWEQRILDFFSERYPASAASAGGRALRIKTRQIFPDFEKALPDERESFFEAAESLEKQNAVSLVWVGRRRGEALSAIVCASPEKLFALAGKPSPAIIAEEARQAARQAAEDALSHGAAESAAPFFAFLARTLNPADSAGGVNARAIRDLSLLAKAFPASTAQAPSLQGITPRALSVSLYADSKRLEGLLALFGRILNRARGRGIGVPGFLSLGRSLPETLIAGKLVFDFAPQAPPLANASGSILGLPLATIRKIRRISPLRGGADIQPPRVLSVENKESFYALGESDFDCLLYSGGHPNGAVRALAELLAASGFEFFHAGDLDPDGILILQELAAIAARPPIPFLMDGETFDAYAGCGRKLAKSALGRLGLIRGETRRLPGIESLIRRIKETGLGVEQEIIDYRPNYIAVHPPSTESSWPVV
ncbi:MAG: DUF2220 family protein [Spirochaetia bacterium]|nr:DUF2220 family protein [Spirochaetia bacterium]